MQSFDSIKQLRNGKTYDTAYSIKMRQNNSTESSPIIKALERNVEDEPEVHVVIQKEVNEQIINHIDSKVLAA